jgi:hypothetical protein
VSDSSFYDDWVADGKPWRNAKPVAEIIAKLKAARPAAANANCFGSIGNMEHLLADPPQDHTPYSQTGWPVHSPYPVVCASDIMHRPDLGVDCNAIHVHLLADAKAGKLPWLKYWIWQGKRYDVRNNWVPVAASGHFDHGHISIRTDHVNTSIGSWHPLPGMDDDMDQREVWIISNSYQVLYEQTHEHDPINWITDLDTGKTIQLPNIPLRRAKRIEAKIDHLTELVEVIGTNNPEVAAIVAALKAEFANQLVKIETIVDTELDEQSLGGADNDTAPQA